jgi:nicotinamide mononucleotide transporter
VTALEWVAVAVSVASVFLTVRQNLWCWPLGMVSVTLYALVFWRERIYANSGLQLVYLALSVYGWWAWLRGGPGHGGLRVTRAPRLGGLFLLLLAAGLTLGLGAFLKRTAAPELPFWDAGTTSASLVAQFMAARKWLENWAVWIAVDVVYVGMFLFQGLRPTALLYAVFLGLAVLGLREWSRALGTDRRRA